MRVKSKPVSSLSPHSFSCSSSPRTRRKHKRLDAICELAYSENHAGGSADYEAKAEDAAEDDPELRRSKRTRRAPVILDASPPPPRKRTKIGMGSSDKKGMLSSSPSGDNEDDRLSDADETPESWKSRLRPKGKRRVSFKCQETSPRGKRRLFRDVNVEAKEEPVVQEEILEEQKCQTFEDKEELVIESSRPIKQKNAGKFKAATSLGGEGNVARSKKRGLRRGKWRRANKVKEMTTLKDEENRGLSEADGVKSVRHELADQGDVSAEALPAKTDSCDGNEVVIAPIHETVAADEIEEVLLDAAAPDAGSTEDSLAINGHADEIMEVTDEGGGGFSGPHEEQCEEEADKLVGESVGNENIDPPNLDKDPAESGQLKNVEKTRNSSDKRSSIKVGRRCGLCGGGTDGKPPKKLVSETADSDDETYHCSSPSEEPNYDILDGFGDGPDWLGRLLGPVNDRYGIAGIWVHQNCAVWSPEVYFAGLGCLKNVRAALCRGRALKCTRCGRPGATIGCRVDRCPKTYHLPCARANGCIFDHRKFLIACTDHRHFFRPHGIKNSNWLKKMRAKKMKLECRKLSNDASRRDIEAEEKWLENCGEDEEFLKRESRRLHRDLLRISPVYIGGASTEEGSVREGWESVAGLQDVIRCMKEVVLLPLLYPEFFDNLGLTPPRGVLLHGYPGTGKTLVVRALIGACARGDRRIAYFARKGADCLGKYVGDAERQLRLLFQVAEKCQPSIIFFDEIDGLAPRRTKQQDQTHSSVVSTLLALLDGLKSRGSVVVIGATNRPDAVDPALRRPGRFDREIYFPLPSLDDRAAILSLHTRKWPKPVSGNLLKFIAKRTAGFAGADLQALCTQVAIIALKRNFPLQEILLAAGKDSPGERVPLPSFIVEDRDWLEALSCSPPPCSRREAGIAANDIVSSPLPTYLLPCLLEPLSLFLASLHNENLSLPPALSRAASRVKKALFSAMEKRQQPVYCWQTHLSELIQDSKTVEDIEKGLASSGLLIEQPISVDNDASDHDFRHSVLQAKHSVTSNQGSGSFISDGAFYSSSKNSGYRLLICGSTGSGQRHFVSCLLHCYIGNVEVQKIDLATVSQEGHGDTVQGITQILMKCASIGSSVVFMPRIDLWALETHSDVSDEESNFKDRASESQLRDEVAESKNLERSSSQAWNSFIEQAETHCVNTSLVVLATSEIAFDALPYRVRQFFRGDVQKRCQSSNLDHAFPRFYINLGSKVDFDMVVERSTVKLSSDIVQQFVQLIHKKYHLHSTSKYSNFDPVPEIVPNGRLTDGGVDSMAQRLDDSSLKTAQVANKRNIKGKSSLLLAISAFGFQILRYPHFAELCWVTSKLKEGPVSDIRGPWKGWPFNSCIIRPYNATERTAVASSPGNVKIEEKYGLVRGLVAVGLSAYKGIYESAKEVSFEIRCVLETLVGQINMKIQAGKDKYDYFRILSQVSYLEDLVNSWAFSLQSLESDAQVTISKATPACIQSTKENALQPEELEPQNSSKVVAEEEEVEGIGLGAGVENNEGSNLNRFDGDVGCSAFSENPGNPVDANNLVDTTDSVDIKHAVADSTKAPEKNGILCENVASSSGALTETEIMGIDGSASASKDDDDPMRDAFRGGAGSEEVCSYRCCPGCISSLCDLMQKLLEGKWGSDRSKWTTEVIHDGVASLSVDLHSVLSTGSSNLFGEREDRLTKSKRCSCSSSTSRLSDPVECSCHNAGGHGESGGVGDRNAEFTVRNGVLDPGVPDNKDANYHCEFEKLCLCSLIESVLLVEQNWHV